MSEPRGLTLRRAATNSQYPCAVPGCRHHRSFTSQWCAWHRDCRRRWGHERGRAIRKQEYIGYVKMARRFFVRHPGHPALIAALALMGELIKPTQEPRRIHDGRYQLSRELTRLCHAGVEPQEALETATAVWLLSYYQPGVLPDDLRLTYALANAVFRLRPLDSRKLWVNGKPHVSTRPPGALPLALLGSRLRGGLAPFFVNVTQALDAEQQTKAQGARDLRAPFSLPATAATTTTNPTQEDSHHV